MMNQHKPDFMYLVSFLGGLKYSMKGVAYLCGELLN
jgi:hypothetical protein